jgi:hypothetical protein
MVDSHVSEDLRRALSLVGFDSHFVSRDFLVVFVAKHGNDVKRRAACQRNGGQFDRLGASAPGGVIEQEMVFRARRRHELAIKLKWL